MTIPFFIAALVVLVEREQGREAMELVKAGKICYVKRPLRYVNRRLPEVYFATGRKSYINFPFIRSRNSDL